MAIPPKYEATATMRVKYSQNPGIGNSAMGNMNSEESMRQQIYTYAEILKSRSVVEEVIDKEYASRVKKPTYEELVRSIDAQPVKNTEILSITVQAPTAEEAPATR